jgi:peptidyl-prolyl cis-trans isomerase SurA
MTGDWVQFPVLLTIQKIAIREKAMKRLLGLILALLICISTASAEIVDRILAKVNDDIITLSEVNRKMAQYRKELEAKYTGQQLQDMIQKLEKQVLDSLIEEKLLYQKAMELGYDANVETNVSSEVQRIMKENNIADSDELEKRLAEQGMTLRDLRDEIRNAIMTRYLINDFVGARITLLTPEIEKYYKDHAADFTTPEEVTLSEIIINVEGSDKEAENRANDLYDRLQKGESFAALASQYSKGPTANKGGSIGTYLVSKLNPDTVKAISGLKDGDVSKPHLENGAYVIYHIDSRKAAALQPLDKVRDEIKNRLYNQRFNPEYERFISQLKEDAYIQIYSETP